MATIVLNWTPAAGSNVTGQLVQRKTLTGSFSTIATLSAVANTYTDTTADDNTVYLYQVVTECEVGGPVESSEVEAVKLVCPDIVITVDGSDVEFALPALTGDAVYQTLVIKEGATIVHTENINNAGPYTTSVALTAGTAYTYTLTIAAGQSTLDCTGAFDTDEEVIPTCDPVTGLTATVS